GGDDLGAFGHEVSEAEVAFDLATRIEGRLGALGVTTYLTRGSDACPDDDTRSRFANDVDADLLVSLHTDAAQSQRPSGVATYYYGASLPGREVRSAVVELIATHVQCEVCDFTALHA